MLRSLELFGFKSFADKTVFDFSAGLTGVVGPNGSGKSNVVDSIKWLLGDQSPRSLRGKEMTDVIFNGSSSRGGSQFAEATLVFDNRTRFLPVEMDEVSVGRRLWQSGDSEYLINRNTARLKDVRELFSGTGAGSSAYCIIEQGRVDQILQSNAANRRLIFEEAAGIARFKSKKAEATRRLDRVEQNLLRLTDIVDEVESQVNAVRSQAQRAARYREVSTELEQLWVGMVSDDYRRQTMVQTELATRRDESARTLEEMRKERLHAEQLSSEAETALSAIDDEIRRLESRRANLGSQISSLETTRRHHSSRDAELETELQRLERQMSVMDGRVAEAEQEEAHLTSILQQEQERLAAARLEKEQNEAQLISMREHHESARAAIEQTRDRVLQQVQANSSVVSRIEALATEDEALQRRITDLQQKRLQQVTECERLKTKVVELNTQQQLALQSLNEAQQEADAALANRDSITMLQSQSRESLAELREQRSAATARRSVLEDLEERQEGFGIGVREILQRAEESTQSPWNLIRGSVADLLDVDMEHAALLEVALSSRAQLLVIDTMQPLVDYLSTGRCRITGRVGFVSLENAEIPRTTEDSIQSTEPTEGDASLKTDDPLRLPEFDTAWLDDIGSGAIAEEFAPELNVTWVDAQSGTPVRQSVFSPSETPTLTGQPGIIGRADSLARSPSQIPHLAALLLADTWVVESLPDAVRVVEQSNGTVRAITPQGELVEPDGTLHTGMVRSETAVVSRKSELRRLKNELNRAQHLIRERELQLEHLAKEFHNTDSDLGKARALVNTAGERLRLAEQELAETQQSANFSEQRIERLDTQLHDLREEQAAVQDRRQTATTDQEAGVVLLESLKTNLNELEQQMSEEQHRIDVLEQGRTESTLELTRLEERAISIQEAWERLKDDLEQRRLQQQEATRRQQAGRQRVQEIGLAQLNVTAELAELYVSDEHVAAQITEHSASQFLLRKRRQEASQLEVAAREHCSQHERQFHELELKISGIEHQLTTSAERIRDEFQVEVQEAVDEGRSALAVWLSGLHAAEAAKTSDTDDSTETTALTVESPEVEAILHDTTQYDELRQAIEQRVDRLRRQLKKIGNVSTESLDNLIELETRFERLHSQLRDLEAARDTLRDMVRRINIECRRMFLESFECIQGHFRELFRRLFGGGEADLILEDPEDVLDCSIDVVARPPGKELRSISLLSGGEKTLTAVALLLSIFRSRPSPFCLLDEVDAALDDANITRFVGVLKEFREETQFIMITHRKPTMAVTDVLYGVTMEESGVSKRLSVHFEEIDEQGNFIPRDGQRARAA